MSGRGTEAPGSLWNGRAVSRIIRTGVRPLLLRGEHRHCRILSPRRRGLFVFPGHAALRWAAVHIAGKRWDGKPLGAAERCRVICVRADHKSGEPLTKSRSTAGVGLSGGAGARDQLKRNSLRRGADAITIGAAKRRDREDSQIDQRCCDAATTAR